MRQTPAPPRSSEAEGPVRPWRTSTAAVCAILYRAGRFATSAAGRAAPGRDDVLPRLCGADAVGHGAMLSAARRRSVSPGPFVCRPVPRFFQLRARPALASISLRGARRSLLPTLCLSTACVCGSNCQCHCLRFECPPGAQDDRVAAETKSPEFDPTGEAGCHDRRARQKRASPVALHPLVRQRQCSCPLLYFDSATAFGYVSGVVKITLEADRLIAAPERKVVRDRAIVAHLRMNIQAALSLKAAIEGALLLASPSSSQSKN